MFCVVIYHFDKFELSFSLLIFNRITWKTTAPAVSNLQIAAVICQILASIWHG